MNTFEGGVVRVALEILKAEIPHFKFNFDEYAKGYQKDIINRCIDAAIIFKEEVEKRFPCIVSESDDTLNQVNEAIVKANIEEDFLKGFGKRNFEGQGI